MSVNINLHWLLTGEQKEFSEADGRVCSEPSAAAEDPELIDLLAGARKVLTSGNQMAFDALARNIQYFSHTIEVEKRLNAMESRVDTLEEVIRRLTTPPKGSEPVEESLQDKVI